MATTGNVTGTPELKGKRALVTGGTRGIGAAVVARLLEAGAEVLTTARTEPDEVPDGVRFVAADVRSRQGAEDLAAAAVDVLGGVDILVHNAGGASPYGSATAIPDEVWLDALNLNLLASVRLNSLLVPAMRERGSGAIVHVSSSAVSVTVPPLLHYTVAKAGLENYSKGLAAELAPAGVRVNTVTPGRVTTPGGAKVQEEWAGLDPTQVGAGSVVPLGRDGQPDDIARAVLFLVSDQASWVTGSNLVVDGGEFPRG
ncbi:oxidoreductase [Streptomyces sp. NPDC058459]|uniref:oxidoreductase n=1 Tax=Streptomyces sp. NPDC058459 TaxID=3346508 RepID=UPI00364992A0